MKKIIIGILIVVGVLIGLYYWMNSRTFQFFGGMINHIMTDKNIIALTFDDGPGSGNTQAILDVLRNNNVQASFYVIGQDIEKNPGLLEMIIKDGHQVGNHSYSHQRMIFKSPGFVKEEIEKTDRLIRNAGYTGDIQFRTPYGKRLIITPYYLRKYNKPNIFFDVEAESFVSSSGDILNYTLQHTQSGSIILLHPMYSGAGNQTIMILDELIRGLKSKGFTFVTVEELMKQTDTQPDFWWK